MTTSAPEAAAPKETDAAAAETKALEGGSYDVIRRRLLEQAAELAAKADALNARRKATFGGSELALVATERVRTEHNCVPRDIVSIGGRLLFGYNVFIGMKAETAVSDVFSLHAFERKDGEFALSPSPIQPGDGFLGDPTFEKEFKDLYRYTKETHLLRLRRTDTKLLAVFQVGSSVRDVKVFRWAIQKGGRIAYVDSRGEEDNVLPRQFDFEWTATRREDHVYGAHPHVSILDEVFVETVGGDLTIKVENNTESGQGIYSEPVEDPNQSLDDAEIHYAKVGALVLLRVRPFREKEHRHFVFNTRTRRATRLDAIARACLELPEDQGIVFPGGYYLRTGEHKVFDGTAEGLAFERAIRSPNGEDVLYVFHRTDDGEYLLLPYNLIRKEVANPIRCHGYSLFDDGCMIVFREQSSEPTRVHPMQVWKTPFTTTEYAASAPTDGSYLSKVGNADLVRGISDAYTIKRLAETQDPTRQTYEDLVQQIGRMVDAYYWLGHAEADDMLSTLSALKKTAELVVDEFEKVAAIRRRAKQALAETEAAQQALVGGLRPEDIASVDGFMAALTGLRKQRGHLVTLREMRFMDLARVDALEAEAVAHFDGVSRACVDFLLRPAALEPLTAELVASIAKIEAVSKASDLAPFQADLDRINEGLSLLAEVVGSLQIDDATARTRILEGISEVYAQQNRARATLQSKKRELSSSEARAEFAAQAKLFGQAVASALAVCDTPERCDEQLSKLLVQLEELEGKFGELDEFLGELTAKREEVTEALGARRQTLVDERQRRARNVLAAAERIVASIARRSRAFKDPDELNTYFASDAMVLKLRDLAGQLVALGETVKADEVESKLKSARQDALRALRDRTELFEDGANVIKLGRHRFYVNTQAVELTLVPRREGEGGEEALYVHLTGTDFYQRIEEPALLEARDFWDQHLVSETKDVYRAEYLAAAILEAAEQGRAGLSIEGLHRAMLAQAAGAGQAGGASGPPSSRAAGTAGVPSSASGSLAGPNPGLLEVVRAFAADKHDEGYERGVHDADATLLLEKLLSLHASAGLLRYGSDARALACLYWASLDDGARGPILRRAQSLGRLKAQLSHGAAQLALATELEPAIAAVAKQHRLDEPPGEVRMAARYLVEELAADRPRFTTSAGAVALRDALRSHLERATGRNALEDDLRSLERHPEERLALALSWLEAFTSSGAETGPGASHGLEKARHLVKEAAVLLVTERRIDRETSAAVTEATVHGLLGQHPRIENRSMTLRLDEFLARLGTFLHDRVPRYRAYRKVRHEVLEREKKRLRLDELTPRVLSSFVRNRLIDEVYLPLVGANLAKQLGAAGDAKRTDLMGLLLLVSPPGYGKTTLMEYVASRLGLVFMKVNGPALGHDVRSLDPAEAPNATARQEVDKINLALEMGNNVMLYLDDIQHTHPELLQKFISLCDAQRRIEGVWQGRTRTYDLRGKKFCVVMAGNPYTESGAKFQIPDMLANRADTYNLGDILEGKGDLFALSYLENALTSNPVLAPLAGRDPGDVHKLIRMARGEDLPITDLAHPYSAAEVAEMVAVLKRLFRVQETLLAVNMQYIASASQDDAYRTEPPFKLQGSYRNMNKIAEKVVAAHTDDELERLIDDHYAAESQTLTSGAEHNLLKLAELRGRMTPEQRARWEEIKKGFVRVKMMGGKDDDPVARVTGSLGGLGRELEGIREALGRSSAVAAELEAMRSSIGSSLGIGPALDGIRRAIVEGAKKVEERTPSRPPRPDEPSATAQIAAVLERIDGLIRATASRPQEVAVRVERDGAVAELLAQQIAMVDRLIVPFARAAAQGAASAQSLDQRLAELGGLLRSVQERLAHGVQAALGPSHYEALLGMDSPSNFYRGVSGGPITRDGGIFVATYRRLPQRGSPVALRVCLPGGVAFDANGVVEWTRESRGIDDGSSPPGFGARFTELPMEATKLIDQYVSGREPLVFEHH